MRHTFQALRGRNSLWNLMTDADEVFDRLRPTSPTVAWFQPAVDIEEGDTHFILSFDLPGMKKEDIKMDVTDRELTVSGERAVKSNRKVDGFHQAERAYGKFHRAFRLPQTVDLSQIKAHYQNGVLEVWIPKAEAAKPKTIEIGSGPFEVEESH